MADIDSLFRMLVERGGSDLHISVGRRPFVRESGSMGTLDLPEMEYSDVEHFVSEIIPEENMVEFRDKNDTDFAYEVPGLARFRANVYRDRAGIGAVFRVIPAEVLSAEKLGLPKGVTDMCYLHKGLVVVTGPTGSGKSTTLAAMIDLVNRTRSDHIITIEDPIEFVHREKNCHITQRELHTHTESFASALRSALRQDPDVVLVGEMRDLATIEIAIETAETGHLVFGTLHTTTAYSTVNRIIDAFPADRQNQIRTMLASSLKGVVAQNLCRRIGGGRTAAFEVLIVDRAVSALIRDGRAFQIPSVMQTGRSRGMRLLNDSLVELVKDGRVEAREAYLKSVERDELTNAFQKNGVAFDPATVQSPGTGSPSP